MNREEAHLTATAIDIPVPDADRVVELPIARDPNGDPLRVRIRKLETSDLILATGDLPAVDRDFSKLEAEQRLVRWEGMPAREKKRILDASQARSEALILAAAIEPVFYRAPNVPDPRPTAEGETRLLAIAPLQALYDLDRQALEREILDLAEGVTPGTTEAQRMARFRGERSQGPRAGGNHDGALPTATAPAPGAGISDLRDDEADQPVRGDDAG